MKEWLTAQEIADARLPQLPTTKRGVNDLAARDGWNEDAFSCRKRAGRGGGVEYHVRLLPTVARVAYHSRHIVVVPAAVPVAANDEPLALADARVTGRAVLERNARLAVCAHFERFRKGSKLRLEQALQIFCDDWRLGRVNVDDEIRDVLPRLTKGSLKRWLSKKRDGAELGVDRSLARKGTGVLDTANGGEVRVFVLGLIAHQPHLSAEQVREQIRFRFGDTIEVVSKGVRKAVDVPNARAIQRLVATLKKDEAVVLTKLTNPDLFRSTMKLSGTGTMRHVTTPNMHWQIDASPVDALCNDGRYAVYVCIDIATRRIIILMSRTPTAAAVGLLLRKAILAWGVPDEIKTDNGSDFVARSTKRLLDSLGVETIVSAAFSPEEKGFVERVIGTFQRDVTPLVPGFIGHSVADRKAIESRRSFAQRLGEDDANTFSVQCSAAEMQALFDDWSTLKYQHRTHGGLKGRTPFEVAASAAHTIRRVDERALDMLLAPLAKGDGTRVVTKFGVRVADYHYLTGSVLPGTRVVVRHDPADKGRIHLFSVEDETYIGEAICAELAGIDPAAFVQAQKEQQAEILREKTKIIEQVRRELRKGPHLADRAREIWLRDVPNVVALPRPTSDHVTPAISAALDAATRDEAKPSAPTGRHAEVHAQLQAEAAAPAATVTTMRETPRIRFRRALALEQAMGRGEAVGAEDALWLGGYQQSPEYRGQKAVHEDFAIGT